MPFRTPEGWPRPVPGHTLQCLLGFLLLILGPAGCTPRPEGPVAEGTRGVERAEALAGLRGRIASTIALPVADSTEERWRAAFWAMQFIRDTSRTSRDGLRRAWDAGPGRSGEFQRALLEAVITVAPEEFRAGALEYLPLADGEKLFAMGAWCARSLPGAEIRIRQVMASRFPAWRSHPILGRLALSLEPRPARPPLVDLLRVQIEPGTPVVFSFQRGRRVFPGLAVIRHPSGRFVREADGRLFAITQLALSLSNLPGFLTNGNTPQGIHSMQGTAVSGDIYIGPTTNLQMKLPGEAGPAEYFHGTRADSGWTPGLYASLLPASWRSYAPVAEAYDAGRAGRFDIIAHGTTIDPSYYRGEPFFPNTPSLGCLCAPERWSELTGRRTASEQQRLIDALAQNGGARGYVVVVELDDEARPVEPADILPEILRAEAGGNP